MNDRKMASIGILIVSLSLFACQNELTLESPKLYDSLCGIYEDVTNRSISLSMKESLIIEEMQDHIPVYFDKNFTHIMYMDSDERYPTMKRLAEEALGEPWDCAAMKSYYETQFNEEPDSQE